MAMFQVGDLVVLQTPEPDYLPAWKGTEGVVMNVQPPSGTFWGETPDPAQEYYVDFDVLSDNPYLVYEPQIETKYRNIS